MKDMLNAMLAADTGQTVERITKDTDRDYIIGAEEAVEYGLIDEVISARVVGAWFRARWPRRMVEAVGRVGGNPWQSLVKATT